MNLQHLLKTFSVLVIFMLFPTFLIKRKGTIFGTNSIRSCLNAISRFICMISPDDLDHVADAPTTTKKSKNPPPKPKPIPRFTPMKINNLVHGLGKLPTHVASTPYRVFSLFFTDEILHKLAEYTNEYAAKHASKEDKPFARKWYPTSLQELRAYIATYIYMGIHSQSKVSDYWNRDSTKSPLHPLVYSHIGLCRWQQIDRFFRISKPISSPFTTTSTRLFSRSWRS